MLSNFDLLLVSLAIRVEHSVFAFVRVTGGVGVEVPDVGFVDTSVAKSSLVSTFVYDHCIFHVVSSVADDCNDSIGSTGTQVEIILQVLCSSHERSLWEQESVDLVVHTIWMTVVRRSHRLFCHLTLVHVSWALIIVAEWNCRGYDR